MADTTVYAADPWAMLSSQHSDIRREAVENKAQILNEVATKTDQLNDDIKTSAWNVSDRVQDEADRVSQKVTDFYIASAAQLSNHNTELAKVSATQGAGFADVMDRIATYNRIGSLETQKYVSEDGEKTRALINDLKNADLNRQLIERNSDVNYYRSEADRWEGFYGNGQFAALSQQINALGSNMAETRQGLYNFGTMAGVGQRSTSNQVGA